MKKVYLETPEAVIKALKEGKVVLDRTGNKYKSINGFIVVSYISGGWGVDPFIGNHEGLYVEESELLKLEVGKFYKTRDGRKAFVCANTYAGLCWVVIIDSSADRPFCCTVDGMFCPGEENEKDLVAPWKEDK